MLKVASRESAGRKSAAMLTLAADVNRFKLIKFQLAPLQAAARPGHELPGRPGSAAPTPVLLLPGEGAAEERGAGGKESETSFLKGGTKAASVCEQLINIQVASGPPHTAPHRRVNAPHPGQKRLDVQPNYCQKWL